MLIWPDACRSRINFHSIFSGLTHHTNNALPNRFLSKVSSLRILYQLLIEVISKDLHRVAHLSLTNFLILMGLPRPHRARTRLSPHWTAAPFETLPEFVFFLHPERLGGLIVLFDTPDILLQDFQFLSIDVRYVVILLGGHWGEWDLIAIWRRTFFNPVLLL